jgi:hypothetical protein
VLIPIGSEPTRINWISVVLRDIRAVCNGPWMVVKNFNIIYKAFNKNNYNLNKAMMGRFRRLIKDLARKEIPLFGRKFNWSNQQDDLMLVNLDRVFYSVDWVGLFLMCCSKARPPKIKIIVLSY